MDCHFRIKWIVGSVICRGVRSPYDLCTQDAKIAFLVTNSSERLSKRDSSVYPELRGEVQRNSAIPEANSNDVTGRPTEPEKALA